jgi:hypothetical protein
MIGVDGSATMTVQFTKQADVKSARRRQDLPDSHYSGDSVVYVRPLDE